MDHGNDNRPRHPAPATANAPAPGSPLVSRRDVLRGAALGGVALFLAACGASTGPTASLGASASATPTPTPSPSPTPSAVPPSPTPAATPSPTPGPSLAERIAGLMVVGFRGSALANAAWVRSALADAGLGGVILFDRDQLTGGSRNIVSPAQVRRLTADLRAAAGTRGIIVSVDQEGGVVTRLGPSHGFPAVASEADDRGGDGRVRRGPGRAGSRRRSRPTAST